MTSLRVRTDPARAQMPLPSTAFEQWADADGKFWLSFHRTPQGFLLRFPGLADFHVSAGGRSVRCVPVPQAAMDVVHQMLLNQVQPLALSRQGRMMFHASAVEVGDVALAFTGESGRGKSTLAATFAAAGHRFLSDDSLELKAGAEGCIAVPGHPSIRLWHDSRRALLPDPSLRVEPVSRGSKVRLPAVGPLVHCGRPRSLRRVYVLQDPNQRARKPSFEKITPREALVELLRQSFLLDAEKKHALASQFEEVVRMAAFPIYYRLSFPRRYSRLGDVRKAIIDHASMDGPTG